METIIINPHTTDTEGIVECIEKGNLLAISYSLTSKESGKVMRLRALSSKKPCNVPLKIDVPVFERGRAEGRKEISIRELGMAGYMTRDIDTFVLTYDVENRIEVAAVGFGGLRWDISYSIGRIYETEPGNPIYNSGKLLEKLRSGKDNSAYKDTIIEAVKIAEKSLGKAEEYPCKKYKWYRFNKDIYPLDLSIFRHITGNVNYTEKKNLSDLLLFGVDDGAHVAVAIKAEGKNPFITAMDCAVYKRGYWIVGVCFKDDGQYFERI